MSLLLRSLCGKERLEACACNDRLLDVRPHLLVLNELEEVRLREARENYQQARAMDQQHFDVLRRTGVL